MDHPGEFAVVLKVGGLKTSLIAKSLQVIEKVRKLL